MKLFDCCRGEACVVIVDVNIGADAAANCALAGSRGETVLVWDAGVGLAQSEERSFAALRMTTKGEGSGDGRVKCAQLKSVCENCKIGTSAAKAARILGSLCRG